MEKVITGIMMYYYKVCTRKLWYFCKEIQMEQESQDVLIGKTLDENYYDKENKHVNIDNTINIDFIRKEGIIHEIKKSKKIEEASIFQVKYYLYYLETKGLDNIKAKIDYPLLKQSIVINLCDDDRLEIEKAMIDINSIINQPYPSELKKKGICKTCAYHDLCYI